MARRGRWCAPNMAERARKRPCGPVGGGMWDPVAGWAQEKMPRGGRWRGRAVLLAPCFSLIRDGNPRCAACSWPAPCPGENQRRERGLSQTRDNVGNPYSGRGTDSGDGTLRQSGALSWRIFSDSRGDSGQVLSSRACFLFSPMGSHSTASCMLSMCGSSLRF